MAVVGAVAATPKSSPWQKKAGWAAVAATPVSLTDIQREQQCHEDSMLAMRMHQEDERRTVPRVAPHMQMDDVAPAPARHIVSSTSTSTSASASACAATAAPETTDEDASLAAILQAEFDAEYERAVTMAEITVNRGNGKVSVSMDRFRSVPAAMAHAQDEEEDEDEEEEDADADVADRSKGMTRDKRGVVRDADGQIVTKHNPLADSDRNKFNLDNFPLSFRAGDVGRETSVLLPTKVFNTMKTFAARTERSRHRLHDKREFSTSDMALDEKTRLILFRLVNGGVLDEINGSISTGKEAVVFSGLYREDPEAEGGEQHECAIKVFKTSLTEFKNRQQFLHGDRRFEDRVGKQSARKLVKVWAEKEMSNLTRMTRAGLPCPRVIVQRRHVLAMTFIGAGGNPAPKLHEATLSSEELESCLAQCIDIITRLFTDCHLVHGDLSAYNLLWHAGRVYVIDVGQAVEPTHPRALEYLYRDCVNMLRFFARANVAAAPTPAALFTQVCGEPLTEEMAVEFSRRLKASKGAPRHEEDLGDSSAVCMMSQPSMHVRMHQAARPRVTMDSAEAGVAVAAAEEKEEEEEEEAGAATDAALDVAVDETDFVVVEAEEEDADYSFTDDDDEEEDDDDEEGGDGATGAPADD